MVAAVVAVASVSLAVAADSSRVEVTVTEAGEVLFAGRAVTVKELARAASDAVKKSEDAEVLIIAAENASLDVVTRVFQALRESGIKKMTLQSR